MDDKQLETRFPLGGVDLTGPVSEQAVRKLADDDYARTTIDAMNVRAFDSLGERARGGSRPGLVKVVARSIVEDWIVQELTTMTGTDFSDLTDSPVSVTGTGALALTALTIVGGVPPNFSGTGALQLASVLPASVYGGGSFQAGGYVGTDGMPHLAVLTTTGAGVETDPPGGGSGSDGLLLVDGTSFLVLTDGYFLLLVS